MPPHLVGGTARPAVVRVVVPSSAPAARHAGLDLLRGIAVLLVLLTHLPGRPASTWPLALLFVARGGWCGVDLFFVLSGFLVGGLLLRDYPAVDVGRFLVRRALKIYPAFYVMLAALVAVFWGTRTPMPGGGWWHEALFVQNYLPKLNVPSWSLAVEEHFYLLLAGTVWVLARRRAPLTTLLGIVAAIAVLEPLLRWWLAPLHYEWTHLRLDSLGWGVGLAIVERQIGRAALLAWIYRRRAELPIIGLVGCAWPFLVGKQPWMFAWGLTAIGVGCLAWLMVALPHTMVPRGWAPVARLGRDSYSVYLWHGPLYWLAGAFSPGQPPWSWPSALALLASSIGVGILMARLVEWPVLAWRDRRWPGRSIGAAAQCA